MSKDELCLTYRTIKIIEKGGDILIKRWDGWYLGCWTNIAAGYDYAHWSRRENALEICNLRVAFAIAKLYDCKVVSYYPSRRNKKVNPKSISHPVK